MTDPLLAVLVDLDSTLADTTHRRHIIDEADRDATDWQAYSMECLYDEPVESNIQLVRMLYDAGYWIAIVSGRDDNARELTEKWLAGYHVPYNELVLRKTDDRTTNGRFKANHIVRDTVHKYVLAIDDWHPVRAELAKIGVPMLQVWPAGLTPHSPEA